LERILLRNRCCFSRSFFTRRICWAIASGDCPAFRPCFWYRRLPRAEAEVFGSASIAATSSLRISQLGMRVGRLAYFLNSSYLSSSVRHSRAIESISVSTAKRRRCFSWSVSSRQGRRIPNRLGSMCSPLQFRERNRTKHTAQNASQPRIEHDYTRLRLLRDGRSRDLGWLR